MRKLASFLALASLAIVAAAVLLSGGTQAAAASQMDKLKDQFLPAEYRNSSLTLDDFKRILREKCKKSSGVENATLYADIEKSAARLTACLSKLANLTAIQEEIEQARPIGELDTVFHKYCNRMPEAERCLGEFNEKLQPCLSADEQRQNAAMVRLASSLMSFMCKKGGDQLALFVAEEGPECFEANKEAIGACANASFAEYLPKDPGAMPDLLNLPELLFEPKHCIDLERFEQCTLHHLGQCTEITPVNIAESVFRFVKNETSCLSYMQAKATERPILRDPRNAATGLSRLGMAALLLLGLASLRIFS